MSTAALKTKLKKLNSRTIPTWDELSQVMLPILPDDIRAAVIRIYQCKELPDDEANYQAWAKENYGQIHAAWDNEYPRWPECPVWEKDRQANEQLQTD